MAMDESLLSMFAFRLFGVALIVGKLTANKTFYSVVMEDEETFVARRGWIILLCIRKKGKRTKYVLKKDKRDRKFPKIEFYDFDKAYQEIQKYAKAPEKIVIEKQDMLVEDAEEFGYILYCFKIINKLKENNFDFRETKKEVAYW